MADSMSDAAMMAARMMARDEHPALARSGCIANLLLNELDMRADLEWRYLHPGEGLLRRAPLGPPAAHQAENVARKRDDALPSQAKEHGRPEDGGASARAQGRGIGRLGVCDQQKADENRDHV